jgi:hypothetical protein
MAERPSIATASKARRTIKEIVITKAKPLLLRGRRLLVTGKNGVFMGWMGFLISPGFAAATRAEEFEALSKAAPPGTAATL